MIETKRDLLKLKRTYKKHIKYLKKLQSLCWSTTYVATYELIDDAEQQLSIVLDKLKNKNYLK